MKRLRALWLLLLGLGAIGSAAIAAPLTMVKALIPVSDGVNLANPKLIPGAVLDYTITVTNPAVNGLIPVQVIRGVTVDDTLPADVKMRVADIGTAGSGPVEFMDGSLLGLGLLGSNLSLTYTALRNPDDGVFFSTNGSDFDYQPTPDADGYDSRIKAVRVRLTGTQAAGSNIRLRFRVGVR